MKALYFCISCWLRFDSSFANIPSVDVVIVPERRWRTAPSELARIRETLSHVITHEIGAARAVFRRAIRGGYSTRQIPLRTKAKSITQQSNEVPRFAQQEPSNHKASPTKSDTASNILDEAVMNNQIGSMLDRTQGVTSGQYVSALGEFLQSQSKGSLEAMANKGNTTSTMTPFTAPMNDESPTSQPIATTEKNPAANDFITTATSNVTVAAHQPNGPISL